MRHKLRSEQETATPNPSPQGGGEPTASAAPTRLKPRTPQTRPPSPSSNASTKLDRASTAIHAPRFKPSVIPSFRDLAAPSARAMHPSHRPPLTEGAGKAGRWPRPWPACRKECRRQSPQVWPKHPALPARWFYDLYAISLGTGCLAPITRRQLISNAHKLDLSTGRPGPRDFTVRRGSFVGTAKPCCDPTASIASHPDVRDDREASPRWGGTARSKAHFSEKQNRIPINRNRISFRRSNGHRQGLRSRSRPCRTLLFRIGDLPCAASRKSPAMPMRRRARSQFRSPRSAGWCRPVARTC